MKFVFIGAGSSVFTMRLVGDLLKEKSISQAQISLVDIDSDVLEVSRQAVESLIRHAGADYNVTAHTDYREALEGADFVFYIFAVGGYAQWKKDIEVCTSHGVLQSVGDTIGPGGIIRTLRTIPVAVEIAREMEKQCPDAYIINYTNPEGAVCLAIQKYTKIKSFGLCHGTPDTAKMLARSVFGVDPARLTYRAAGVNHLTWFTGLRIDGHDVYPELPEKLRTSGMAEKEPVSADLYEKFGLYPAPGDRHVGEFFPFYLREEVLAVKNYKWKNNDFIAVDQWREDARLLLDEIRLHGRGFEAILEGSGETAAHFIRSLSTGEVSSEMVNVINRGYIENVSDGIIVEIPVFTDSFGLHPQKIGRLPEAIADKCDALGREYLRMVDAAVLEDRKLALQAMLADPLVSNCNDPEALLDDLIRTSGIWRRSE